MPVNQQPHPGRVRTCERSSTPDPADRPVGRCQPCQAQLHEYLGSCQQPRRRFKSCLVARDMPNMRALIRLLTLGASAVMQIAAAPSSAAERRLVVMISCNANQAGTWVCDQDAKYAAMCPDGGGLVQAQSVPPGDPRCFPKSPPQQTFFSTQTVISTYTPPHIISTTVVVLPPPTVTASISAAANGR